MILILVVKIDNFLPYSEGMLDEEIGGAFDCKCLDN